MKVGILVLFTVVLMASISSYAVKPIEEASVDVVDDIYELKECYKERLAQVPPIPSLEVWLDTRGSVYPVNWKKFPKDFTKQMYAEMDVLTGYPLYSVICFEDYKTRETVFLNRYDSEMCRLSPPSDYDPLSALSGLDSFNAWIFDPAHTAVELTLIPEVFYADYQAEKVARNAVVSLDAMTEMPEEEDEKVSVGMALVSADAMASSSDGSEEVVMAMSSIPAPPDGGNTNSIPGGGSSNLLVELTINLPVAFGQMGHIEIFTKDDLVYSSNWALATGGEWVPTLGSQTVKWIDSTSSNKSCSFFFISDGTDSDGDGHSDLHEEWANTNPTVFDEDDEDTDGINDWWEMKLFGDLSQNLLDDTDGDGLTNNVEIVVDSMGRLVAMLSDPALADSDADEVDDYDERRVWFTEPMNPDTDGDGLEDGAEVNGTLKTNPKNSDMTSPIVAFAGS